MALDCSTNQMCNYSTSTPRSFPVLFACHHLVVHEKNHISTCLLLDPTSKSVQSLVRDYRHLPKVMSVGAYNLEYRIPLLLVSNRRWFLDLHFFRSALLFVGAVYRCGTRACPLSQNASDRPRNLDLPEVRKFSAIRRHLWAPAQEVVVHNDQSPVVLPGTIDSTASF